MTVFFDEERQRWRYDFQLSGVRYARECVDTAGNPVTSKRAAQDAENEARRIAKIGPKLARANDLTLAQVLNDLCEKWMLEKGWSDRQRMVREILAYFGPEKPMREIDGASIQDYVTHALRQPLRVWIGGPDANPAREECWKIHPSKKMRSPATVNRYLPILRAAFKRAYETRDPITGLRAIEEMPKVEELKEIKRKARPVPDDVLSFVIENVPEHVIEATKLTLFFGFRRNEAFNLKIAQVDFHARGIRLAGADVKNKTDAFVAGSNPAMQFLAQLVDQARERRSQHLITYTHFRQAEKRATAKWRPIKSPKTAWKTVMDKVEAKFGARWRWHDIRAAYITQIAMLAGPVAAQKMARHSDFATTQGYIDVADDVQRRAADAATDRPVFGIVQGGKPK